MDRASVKNDIKMLFHVVNSLNGLLGGLYMISIGITLGIVLPYNMRAAVVYSAIGLAILALTALGYWSAIVGKKSALVFYSLLSGAAAILQVAAYALIPPWRSPYFSLWLWQSSIFLAHAGILMVGTALAATLAVQAGKNKHHTENITSETPKEKSEINAHVLNL